MNRSRRSEFLNVPSVSHGGPVTPALDGSISASCVNISLMNYKDRITIEPDKRGGKPCIRGMRITVYDILSYLAAGMTEQEILDDFPYLTKEDILACLSYAADREHQQMVIQA